MTVPVIALPLAGDTIGSHDNGFVIAELKDADGHTGERRLQPCGDERVVSKV